MAEVKKTSIKQETSNKEPIYMVEELIAVGDKIFETPKECITAAFKMEKKDAMTVSEAKAVVKRFMERKVN